MIAFGKRFCSRSGRCRTGCKALDHRVSGTKELFEQQAASRESQRGGWDLQNKLVTQQQKDCSPQSSLTLLITKKILENVNYG